MDKPDEGISFWVSGVVAVRDGLPYVQLQNADRMIAQLTMSQARQIADDILVMCSRTEADAMILKFFSSLSLPHEGAVAFMQQFRDFRHELDMDKAERRDDPEAEGRS